MYMNMISRDSLAECVFFFLDYWLGGAGRAAQCVMCADNGLGADGGRAVADKLESVPNLKVLKLYGVYGME